MSEVLSALAATPGERVTVAAILGALSERSFAIVAVLLGLPNCFPMPPPIPALCSLLLILVALQIVLLRQSLWLPGILLRRSVAKADLARAIGRAMPWVARLERWSQPRWTLFDPRFGGVLGGLLLLTLAMGMLFAAPFVGQVPYGLAVCLVGLGLIERDGLLVVFGVLSGCLGVGLSASFLFAIVVAVRNLV